MRGETRHPQHDDVAAELRSWYVTPAPGLGLVVEDRNFGVYTTVDSRIGPRVFLRIDDAALVADAVDDIRRTYPDRTVDVYLDDRRVAEILHGPLIRAGCTFAVSTVYLTLVGDGPASPSVPGMTMERVTDDLTEWARVRVLGFSNTEEEPGRDRLREEAARWAVEAADVGRFVLARVDGEPVGVLAYYDGDDRLVFNLATRVPYRGRGIARALLAWFASDGMAAGCRSLSINADEGDWPVALYRRLGFVDEVLWHRRYVLSPAESRPDGRR